MAVGEAVRPTGIVGSPNETYWAAVVRRTRSRLALVRLFRDSAPRLAPTLIAVFIIGQFLTPISLPLLGRALNSLPRVFVEGTHGPAWSHTLTSLIWFLVISVVNGSATNGIANFFPVIGR